MTLYFSAHSFENPWSGAPLHVCKALARTFQRVFSVSMQAHKMSLPPPPPPTYMLQLCSFVWKPLKGFEKMDPLLVAAVKEAGTLIVMIDEVIGLILSKQVRTQLFRVKARTMCKNLGVFAAVATAHFIQQCQKGVAMCQDSAFHLGRAWDIIVQNEATASPTAANVVKQMKTIRDNVASLSGGKYLQGFDASVPLAKEISCFPCAPLLDKLFSFPVLMDCYPPLPKPNGEEFAYQLRHYGHLPEFGVYEDEWMNTVNKIYEDSMFSLAVVELAVAPPKYNAVLALMRMILWHAKNCGPEQGLDGLVEILDVEFISGKCFEGVFTLSDLKGFVECLSKTMESAFSPSAKKGFLKCVKEQDDLFNLSTGVRGKYKAVIDMMHVIYCEAKGLRKRSVIIETAVLAANMQDKLTAYRRHKFCDRFGVDFWLPSLKNSVVFMKSALQSDEAANAVSDSTISALEEKKPAVPVNFNAFVRGAICELVMGYTFKTREEFPQTLLPEYDDLRRLHHEFNYLVLCAATMDTLVFNLPVMPGRGEIITALSKDILRSEFGATPPSVLVSKASLQLLISEKSKDYKDVAGLTERLFRLLGSVSEHQNNVHVVRRRRFTEMWLQEVKAEKASAVSEISDVSEDKATLHRRTTTAIGFLRRICDWNLEVHGILYEAMAFHAEKYQLV